jgi:hypothetical protein
VFSRPSGTTQQMDIDPWADIDSGSIFHTQAMSLVAFWRVLSVIVHGQVVTWLGHWFSGCTQPV